MSSITAGHDMKGQESEVLYFPSETLEKEAGDSYVSSRTYGSFFIPSKQIPKLLKEDLLNHQDRTIEELLFGERALVEQTFKYPYWKNNPEINYDEMRVSLYGSIALTDDRNVLDGIIATGSQLLSPSTQCEISLRDVCGFLNMDIDTLNSSTEFDRPLLNRGVYFHIKVPDLLRHLGLSTTTKNRVTIRNRLLRISKMMFVLKYFNNGTELPGTKQRNIIYSDELHFLLDSNSLKNKNNISPDTYTDIIVCINDQYLSELTNDGFLSRKRLMDVYPDFNKIYGLSDFLKFIDSHKRSFINKKRLTWLIDSYYDSKPQPSLSSMNIYHVKYKLFEEVKRQNQQILEHFGFTLCRENVVDLTNRYNNIDYRLVQESPDK
nr:hypothetical protein [Shewanella xiamenensis]